MFNTHEKRSPWWIAFGATLALVVGNASISLFSFGLFIKPISSEFGWQRGTLTAASAAAGLASALLLPLVGHWMGRYGIRRVLVPALLCYAASVAAMSLAPSSPGAFILMYAIVGLCATAQGPMPYVKSVSAWFDGRRGIALGIAMAGVGVGTALGSASHPSPASEMRVATPRLRR